MERLEGNGSPNPEYSLRRFAKRVGVSPALLSQVENGELPPPKAETVAAIADALGLDREALLTKARRIDPELQRIVIERQQVLADFLRTADNMSNEELKKAIDRAQGTDGEAKKE